MIDYVNISHKFFGGLSKSLRSHFVDIKEDLQKANIKYTLDEYISIVLFTTTITFFMENILLAFIFGFMMSTLNAVILALILSTAISGLLLFSFYSYPTALAKNRENKIRKVLPFAVSYLASIASSKVSPIVLFRTISKFKEYGEVAEESNIIVRDVDTFGMTFSSALKRRAKRTPSRELRELLWGINTVISSGADLGEYLSVKSDELINDYRRRIRKYSQDLSLFVEIYLTLIITGSIFFIVLSSVIVAISGGIWVVSVQSFTVFILLPMLSIAFIIIIKSISPT